MNRLVSKIAMPAPVLLVAALLAAGTPVRADVTPVDDAALERLMQRGVPVIDIRTPEEWRETGIIDDGRCRITGGAGLA